MRLDQNHFVCFNDAIDFGLASFDHHITMFIKLANWFKGPGNLNNKTFLTTSLSLDLNI